MAVRYEGGPASPQPAVIVVIVAELPKFATEMLPGAATQLTPMDDSFEEESVLPMAAATDRF